MTHRPTITDAEATIRAATVARIRTIMPGARIIHELAVDGGRVRADVAAVCDSTLILFEIKSSRDSLKRLPNQLRHFHPVCHGLVVVADEKWCGRATAAGYPNCDARAIIAYHAPRAALWEWRGGADGAVASTQSWSLPHVQPPWPLAMLGLLTTAELREVGAVVGIEAPVASLRAELAMALTGHEVSAHVCAALRSRPHQWADPCMGRAA